MTITLTPELEALVRQKVESGRYDDAGSVVQAALLLLDAHEQQLERLRAAVAAADEQFKQGKYARWTPELRARLRREAEELVEQGYQPHPDVRP